MEDKLERCKEAQRRWSRAFESRDIIGCSSQYTENATIDATPLGVFSGRKNIEVFWKSILDNKELEISYTNVMWKKASDLTYLLSSSWVVNGVLTGIRREQWQVIDEHPYLIHDVFEIQDEITCMSKDLRQHFKLGIESEKAHC